MDDFKVEEPFRKRQFSEEVTHAQIVFDMFACVIVPIILLLFDPVLFKSDGMGLGAGALHGYRIPAYLVMALCMSGAFFWLAFGIKNKWTLSMLCLGAFVSFVVGVVLIPISFIGLVIFIGIFGFFPFVTCFSFWRNYKRMKNSMKESVSVIFVTLFVMLSLAIPLGVHQSLKRSVEDKVQVIMTGTSEEAKVALESLESMGILVDTDILANKYYSTPDENKARLEAAYSKLTDGEDLTHRMYILHD